MPRTLNKYEVSRFFSVPKEERDDAWETAIILRLKRFVKQMARISYEAYNGSRKDILDLEDFESVAYIGLLRAIREYEPSLGSFHNFSSTCIQNAIRNDIIKKMGREEYLLIPLKEVDNITDGGIEETLETAYLDGFIEYIRTRFENLLTPNEFAVLCKLFEPGSESRSETAIGKELGMHRGYVQLLKRKALAKIRRCMSTRAGDWGY